MQNRPQPPRPNGETRRPVQSGGARPVQPRPASYNANAPQRPSAPRQSAQPPRYAQSRPAAQQMRPRAAYPSGARPAQPRPAPRPAPARPAPHGNGITLYRPSILKPIALLAAALAVGILLQFVLMPSGWTMAEKPRATEAVAEIASSRGVRINEVMTANKSACYDETGACPDWIELYNASSSPVDITGWVLTDKTSRSIRFTFPEHVMQSGEYVIVFASGLLKNDAGGTWHAPFKLSSAGDTLLLFDEGGTIVQSMNIPALDEDCVYALGENGTWSATREYTPLMENTSYNYALLTTTQVAQDSDLIITEIMASNASYPSPNGGLYDWIEITNRGSEAINLSGYGLSDKATKPSRWRFPDVTIQPGEYIVVYASGLDKTLDGEMHADFRLASEGESVYLYNASRQVLDTVTYDNLKTDQSYQRQADGTWSVSTSPTPGKAN